MSKITFFNKSNSRTSDLKNIGSILFNEEFNQKFNTESSLNENWRNEGLKFIEENLSKESLFYNGLSNVLKSGTKKEFLDFIEKIKNFHVIFKQKPENSTFIEGYRIKRLADLKEAFYSDSIGIYEIKSLEGFIIAGQFNLYFMGFSQKEPIYLEKPIIPLVVTFLDTRSRKYEETLNDILFTGKINIINRNFFIVKMRKSQLNSVVFSASKPVKESIINLMDEFQAKLDSDGIGYSYGDRYSMRDYLYSRRNVFSSKDEKLMIFNRVISNIQEEFGDKKVPGEVSVEEVTPELVDTSFAIDPGLADIFDGPI